MAHLIRTVSGTNRDPIYGPWRNCPDCRNFDPAETAALDELLAETPQELGMTLAEFWDAVVGAKLERAIRA